MFNTLKHTIDNIVAQVLSEYRTFRDQKGSLQMVLHDLSNISAEEKLALKSLSSNPNITIKPADKGNAIVILNTADYILEAETQLANTKYYTPLLSPIFLQTRPLLHDIVDNLGRDGYIDVKYQEYLKGPSQPAPRKFYSLPKIHKDPNLWFRPHLIPKSRPIINDIDSESYRITSYIDSFLSPLSRKHQAYVKDSFDFVDRIRYMRIQPDTILVTADISALYTNMNQDRMLSTVRDIFQLYPDPTRPDLYLLQLLQIVLTKNDFTFNGRTYLQTCGCPMGKNMGPSLANIYLLEFDDSAMNGFHLKPQLYFRYFDDIFCLWQHGRDNLELYMTFLNHLIPDIKLEFTTHIFQISFLDVSIYKSWDNHTNTLQLLTTVYFKPTDTHALLHKSSHHPQHTFSGILKSQLIRYKYITSSWEDFLETVHIVFPILYSRSYSWSFLWRLLKDVWFNHSTLNPLLSMERQIFPIVQPYNSLGVSLSNKFKTLLTHCSMFKEHNLVKAYTNHRNLKNILVSSKIRTTYTQS